MAKAVRARCPQGALVIQSEAGNHDRFARANRKPSIIPAGPPPTTQHFVVIGESVIWIIGRSMPALWRVVRRINLAMQGNQNADLHRRVPCAPRQRVRRLMPQNIALLAAQDLAVHAAVSGAGRSTIRSQPLNSIRGISAADGVILPSRAPEKAVHRSAGSSAHFHV